MSFGGSLFGGSSTSTPATSAGFGNLFANAGANNAAKPATPSLFGNASTTASTAPSTGGLFGSTAASSTPAITLQPPGSSAPTTSLFGNSTAAPAPAAGGLFGNAAASSAPAAAGGLFGSAAAASSAPSGGLFGNASAAAPAATGGLFGNAAPASSAPSGGLFGSTAASAAPAAGGLFGAASAQSQPAATSLFGGAQRAQGTSSLFGASTNTANAPQAANTYKPLFSSLGAATTQPQQANQSQQQQQVVQGVRIDLSNVKPTTRFYELHESLQNEIIQAEEFIQSQINLITQCGVFMPAHGTSLTTLEPDVKFVQNTLNTVASALAGDALEINAVKGATQQDVQDCTRAFAAVEHLKLPAQWQYNQGWSAAAAAAAAASSTNTGGGSSSATAAASADASSGTAAGAGSAGVAYDGENAFAATDMVPYFSRQTAQVDARLHRYGVQLAEIEAHLRTVEGGAVDQMRRVLARQQQQQLQQERVVSSDGEEAEKQVRGQVAELASAMHVFEEAVLRVAGRVGETRESVIECTIGGLYGNGSSRR